MNLNKISRRNFLCAVGLTTAATLTACGSSASSAAASSAAASSGSAAEPVELIVFAAASLSETLTAIGETYSAENPGVTFRFNFDSSGTLKTQIQEGADCDVFISAGQKQMNQLDSTASADVNTEGLDFVDSDSRVDLLKNKVVLCVPEGSDKGIDSFDALAEHLKAEDILYADLALATREKAVRMGLNGEYFMSGRIDDLECAYTTLWGFLQGRGEEEGRGDIWVMFDNEEVGSSSRQGAQGTLMADVLARIEESMGVSREQSIRARTNSLVLSADNGHATHPNHPEKSDPSNPVVMGGGVLLKYNARQTYTTSGFTGAAFTAICKKAGVPVQVFANRADVPGGSTLGNLLGHQILMPMVDIGLGQLAMHSAMETASCADAEYMAKAVAEYYNTPIFQPKDGEWKLSL